MRKKLLIIMISYVLLPLGLIAQDTIPDLIISEARFRQHPEIYIEICNVGDSALNLDQFLLEDISRNSPDLYFNEGTILEPGETYLISNTYDEPGFGWQEIQPYADQLVHQWELGELFNQGILVDSASTWYLLTRPFGGGYGFALWYKKNDTDSMLIDCFNWAKNEAGETIRVDGGLPIAGVIEPVINNTIIRKSTVLQGNLGDWEASRGTDAADSEWLLAEHLIPPTLPFTTVGNHGDYSIDVTAGNPDVTVDLDNGTLTVPWGIYRGDSIIHELNLGDGMAWWYIEKPVFEDSIHTIVQTGDILQVKAFGSEMVVQDLTITVSDPANDMNLVFPRRNVISPDSEDPPGAISVIGGTRYYVTENMAVMDTIGNVPFATRVDTLYNYIEWASNASAEIIWKDGNERVDLMNGDILEVTAENGGKKQYYIDVQEYVFSDNALLSAITWPDITTEDNWDFSWLSDTIPGFSPTAYQYNITLAYGTSKVPALKAYTEDLNARVEVTSAISLSGGLDERTTVLKVISESDTVEREYSVTFDVYQLPENQQKFFADPLFSEFQHKFKTIAEFLEICNPGNQPLDLSRYLIAEGKGVGPAEAVQQTLDSANRYSLYVPGYRWADNAAEWDNEDYKILKFDGAVDPVVEPGGVFVIGARQLQKAEDRDGITPDRYNIGFPEDRTNIWGLSFDLNTPVLTRHGDISLYLFRIDNDAVLNGAKPIGDMDDLTLIDVIGYPEGTVFGDIGGYDWGGEKGHKITRKPEIFKGNPSYYESAGTTPENSEWNWANQQVEGLDWDEHFSSIGNHPLQFVTVYKSTVASLVYIIDDGFEGDLNIIGIGSGETVEQFIDNLILPDTGQVQIVKTGTTGDTLTLANPISQGDTLVVISADGKNITKYLLDTTPLDGNTNLVASDGSTLTVADGAVSGFAPGTKLEDVLAGVETESELSILNVVDATGVYIPFQLTDFEGNYKPVLATAGMYIQVVAQNGDGVQYQLKPDVDPADAFVLSSIYAVDQEFFIITGIPGGTAVSAFMANLTPAEGATVTIMDKADYERTLGNLAYDDVLTVVSSDGANTVTYMLNFVEEVIINAAPSVTITSDNIEVEVGVSTSVSATAEDDGLPAPPGELSYTWSVSSGEAANVTIANPDQATTDVTFSAVGSYELQVAVNDGELESVATVSVSVITGIETYSSAFRMYPNPASEAVIFEFADKGSEAPVVSIYNITGKSVYKGLAESSTMTIDVSGMEAGLYFVKIETGGETITRKLSVVK